MGELRTSLLPSGLFFCQQDNNPMLTILHFSLILKSHLFALHALGSPLAKVYRLTQWTEADNSSAIEGFGAKISERTNLLQPIWHLVSSKNYKKKRTAEKRKSISYREISTSSWCLFSYFKDGRQNVTTSCSFLVFFLAETVTVHWL